MVFIFVDVVQVGQLREEDGQSRRLRVLQQLLELSLVFLLLGLEQLQQLLILFLAGSARQKGKLFGLGPLPDGLEELLRLVLQSVDESFNLFVFE